MLNVVDIQYGSGTDAMSASDLRAASGQAVDDQDPETNGKAENEGERLEMEQIEREDQDRE